MKLLFSLILVGITVSVYGQGEVNFQNRNTSITPAINAPISYDGTGPVPAQKIDGDTTFIAGPYTYGGIYARAALYGGPAGTPEEQLVLLGPAVGFRTSPAAGYLQETNPVRVVEGVLPGASAVFQVRAWDAGVPDIHSYEEAQALIGACHPVYFNRSPLLNVAALGGDGAPPADLIGLQAFSLGALPMESPTPATIRVSPQSRLATAGESVTLNVVVEGSYPIFYQWLFNGTPLPSATNNSLTINSIRLADAGGYSVRVSNCAGVATSEVAVVTVLMLWVKSGNLILSEPDYTFLGSAPIQIQSGFTNGAIFYTLDGTPPGPGSTPYLSGFVMDRSAVIRAIAYSADMAESYETPSIRINIVRPGFCALSAATRGGGTVAVDPDFGPFPLGSPVNLTATAWPGWKFLGWAGDASGTNPSIQLTMDRGKFVEAVFGTTVGTTCIGTGAVAVTPSLEYYPYGTTVQIAALPGAGSFFSAWGGDVAGATNPLVLTVTNPNPSITCTFEQLSTWLYSLTVVPVGNGKVDGFPIPLRNRLDGATYFHLVATADPGQEFVGWTGDATGSNPVIALIMDRSKTIYAVFTKKPKLVVTTSYGHNDGLFRWSLAGNLGEACTIYGSSNMVDWAEVQVITNTLGSFYFVDPDTSNQSQRFFRVEGR